MDYTEKLRREDTVLTIDVMTRFNDDFFHRLQKQKYYVLIIDKSESMDQKGKWDNVVQIIRTVKTRSVRLDIEDNIYCIFFDEGVSDEMKVGLGNLEVNENEIRNIVTGNKIYPNGFTNITFPIYLAVEWILEHNLTENEVHIILLTDGVHNRYYDDYETKLNDFITNYNFVVDPRIITALGKNKKNEDVTLKKLEQLRISCRLIRQIGASLHIFALGKENREKSKFLNRCVNNAMWDEPKSKEHNEASNLLKIPDADDPINDYISFLITGLMDSQQEIIPELELGIIIEELATFFSVESVSDISYDREVSVGKEEVLDGDDFIFRRTFRDVDISDPPSIDIMIGMRVGKNMDGSVSLPIVIEVDEFRMEDSLTLEVSGIVVDFSELCAEINQVKYTRELKDLLIEAKEVEREMLTFLKGVTVNEAIQRIPDYKHKIQKLIEGIIRYATELGMEEDGV